MDKSPKVVKRKTQNKNNPFLGNVDPINYIQNSK